MKDPFDNRPDIYALLNCSEDCTRADAQRGYTGQLVKRAAPQRDLQSARELLVRANQRLLYDMLLYNLVEVSGGSEDFKALELDMDAFLPLKWTSPEPPDVEELLNTDKPAVPELPIEFDC